MRYIWSSGRWANESFRRPGQAWPRHFLLAAVGLPLLTLGCTRLGNRSNAPSPALRATTPPQIAATAPTATNAVPVVQSPTQTEAALEAEASRLQKRMTVLMNTLDQQISARLQETEREMGELYIDVYSDRNIAQDMLEATLKQRMENSQELTSVKAKLKSMDGAAKEGKPWPDAQNDVRQDARCQALRQRLDALDIDIAVAQKDPNPDKAAVDKLKRQRDAIQQKLDVLVNDLTDTLTTGYRQRLEERALTLDQNLFASEQTVEQLGKRLGKINELKSEYFIVKQKSQSIRDEIRDTEKERARVLEKLETIRSSTPNSAR